MKLLFGVISITLLLQALFCLRDIAVLLSVHFAHIGTDTKFWSEFCGRASWYSIC